MQEDTNRVVQTIHEGVDNVRQGIKRTRETREALGTIIHSAQQASSVVTEIADALQALMIANQTVVSAMDDIHSLTGDFATMAKEQENRTVQIDKAAETLMNFMAQFQESATRRVARFNDMLETAHEVTRLIDKNSESSQNLAAVTDELASQTDTLLQSVDRFELSAHPAVSTATTR